MAEVIFHAVLAKLAEAADGTRFRLIGVRVADMSDSDECDPPTPFDPGAARRAHIERTMDDVRAKMGAGAIAKGISLRSRRRYSADAE